MIEEAAGTMMYESKKQQAQKTIEKKDSKLREINDVSQCTFTAFEVYWAAVRSSEHWLFLWPASDFARPQIKIVCLHSGLPPSLAWTDFAHSNIFLQKLHTIPI